MTPAGSGVLFTPKAFHDAARGREVHPGGPGLDSHLPSSCTPKAFHDTALGREAHPVVRGRRCTPGRPIST